MIAVLKIGLLSLSVIVSTRAKIVQRESLNRIGNKLHIDAHVRASSHSSSHNSYICGNAVEAIVGAFYIDHGYKRAKKFIINRIIKQHFNLDDLISSETNFKSRLIEWTQKAMSAAAKNLDFIEAAQLRDELLKLKDQLAKMQG